ncbi:uncharacterized protein LOC123385157 [Felis catus]|uniref:uncharacterized protein LOC123385157 n=1 Tax=Felis catus TaxID=9685 RepID=UPI000948752E|nr:uncharacterized protein LOC123385157 [Felis catus]
MSVVHVACPAFPKVHLRGWGCAWERACTCVTNFVPLCPRPGFLFSAASGSVESPRARDGLVLWECALNFNSRFGNLDGWGRISEVLRRDSGVLSLWPLRAAGPRAPSGRAPVDPPPTAAGVPYYALQDGPGSSSQGVEIGSSALLTCWPGQTHGFQGHPDWRRLWRWRLLGLLWRLWGWGGPIPLPGVYNFFKSRKTTVHPRLPPLQEGDFKDFPLISGFHCCIKKLDKPSLIAMNSVSNFCDRHLRIMAQAFTLLFTSNCSFCSWNNSEDMIFEQCMLKGQRKFLLMSMVVTSCF